MTRHIPPLLTTVVLAACSSSSSPSGDPGVPPMQYCDYFTDSPPECTCPDGEVIVEDCDNASKSHSCNCPSPLPTQTYPPTRQVPAPDAVAVVPPAGNGVFFRNGKHGVTEIAPDTNNGDRTLAADVATGAFGVANDGSTLYGFDTGSAEPRFFLLDLTGATSTPTYPPTSLAGIPHDIVVIPGSDNKIAVAYQTSTEVWLVQDGVPTATASLGVTTPGLFFDSEATPIEFDGVETLDRYQLTSGAYQLVGHEQLKGPLDDRLTEIHYDGGIFFFGDQAWDATSGDLVATYPNVASLAPDVANGRVYGLTTSQLPDGRWVSIDVVALDVHTGAELAREPVLPLIGQPPGGMIALAKWKHGFCFRRGDVTSGTLVMYRSKLLP